VRFDEPLTLQDSEPEPDIAIVRGSDAEFASAHPTTAELVIEIAVTSLADDREMASIYAEAGVKEFWIVIAQKQQIEVHAQPENGHYLHERLYNTDEIIQCSSLPQIKLRVGDLFSELSA
jgi:Uma2 family endonuclease